MSEPKNEFSRDQEAATIPFFVHEASVSRMERVNKRLWIALLVIFIALIGTNAGWIIYESQFQDEIYSYELSQDSGEGGENTYTNNRIVIGGDFNSEANGKNNGEAPGTENYTDAENVTNL